MLFKFTFIPNVAMTQRKILGILPYDAKPEDVEEYMMEIFRPIYNAEYHVFVYAEDLVEASRKLSSWYDDESCILNHPNYERVVMNMVGECVDPTPDGSVLLNSLAVIR